MVEDLCTSRAENLLLYTRMGSEGNVISSDIYLSRRHQTFATKDDDVETIKLLLMIMAKTKIIAPTL